MTLVSPDGKAKKTLDVPWTVIYGGDKGKHPWRAGKGVDCDDVTVAPFDGNVDCMRRTVIFGDAAVSDRGY